MKWKRPQIIVAALTQIHRYLSASWNKDKQKSDVQLLTYQSQQQHNPKRN